MPAFRCEIRVKPGASRTSVGGSYGESAQLIVSVTAPAVDGKANEAVIAALSAALGIKSRNITVIHGHTSRTKLISVEAQSDQACDVLRDRVTRLLVENT